GLATRDPAAISLTERGRAQAGRLAAGFVEPPSLVVTSAYARTKQTAQPTRERFPDVPHEQWPVQEFTYLHSLHGRLTTAAQRRPMVDAYWLRADPSHVERPGAESFTGLLIRARELVERLSFKGCGDGPVAVFSHGMFIRAVLWTLMTGPGAPTPES